jgi:hypothetical protein
MQIWADQRGRSKLSDFPLRDGAELDLCSSARAAHETWAPETKAVDSGQQQALRLLRDVAKFCTADDEAPAEALDLLHDLEEGSTSCSSPRSIWERLRAFVDRPYQLRWDDRLGILAISTGLETMLLCPPALVVSYLLASFEGPAVLAVGLAAVAGLTAAAIMGYSMRGGLAFWLTNTEIRDKSGQPASGLRCAWRNIVAWFPLITAQAIIGWMNTALNSELRSMVGGQYMGVLSVVLLIGGLYAIVQPRRGLQDWAAGTRLVRRSA